MAAVARENPQLHEEYLRTYNVAARAGHRVAALADATRPPTPPTNTSAVAPAGDDGDPIVAWNDAVRAKMNAGMSPQRAVEKVVNEKPDLHQKYIAAVNARR